MNEAKAIGDGLVPLSTAFTAGLADTANPGSFANLLIFIIFLSWTGSTAMRIAVFGAAYLAVSECTQFLSVRGYWDSLLLKPSVMETIRALYFLMAAAFVFIAVNEIRDWWRFKISDRLNSVRLKLPVFFDVQDRMRSGQRRTVLIFVRDLLFACLISFITALMSTVYPQNEHIFIVHSYWMSGGDYNYVWGSFFLYALAMVIWMIVAWIGVGFMSVRKISRPGFIIYFKGVLAALYISTAVGIIYYFLY